MAGVQGYAGQLGLGTVSPVTQRLQFRDSDLGAKATVVNGNGIRGTRSYSIEPVRDGNIPVDGPINLIPNAVELAACLPWILGGTPSGSPTVTYPLGDVLTDRYVTVDGVARVFTYDGVKVDTASFQASEGTNLTLGLDLVAKTETVASAGTFPVLSLPILNGPFVFTDLTLSINSVSVSAKDFNLNISNVIDRGRFLNSVTMMQVNEQDRVITFSTTIPYGDHVALYGAGGAAGVAVVGTFTNGSAVLTFTMPKVALLKKNPMIPGRSEILLSLAGQAFKVGSTNELSITLNPGP